MKLTPAPDPIPGKTYLIVVDDFPVLACWDGTFPRYWSWKSLDVHEFPAYEVELPARVVKLTSQQVADLSHRAGTLIRHIENTRALSVRINDKPLPDDMPEVVALRAALVARYQAELDALLTVGGSDAS